MFVYVSLYHGIPRSDLLLLRSSCTHPLFSPLDFATDLSPIPILPPSASLPPTSARSISSYLPLLLSLPPLHALFHRFSLSFSPSHLCTLYFTVSFIRFDSLTSASLRKIVSAPFRHSDRRDLGTVSISDFHRILVDLGSPLMHAEVSLIAEKYRAMQGSARRGRLGDSSSSSSSAESIRTFKGNAVRGKYRSVLYCAVRSNGSTRNYAQCDIMSCHAI